MDLTSVKESDIVIDIETTDLSSSKEAVSHEILDDQVVKMVSFTVCGMPMVVDELANGEILVSQPGNVKHVSQISSDSGKNAKKEGPKSMSAKKPPKAPRPPKWSLDAADQKLIAELSMIKRARIERMKALKKMKAAKASSSVSASSSGNLVALLFTILFCVVIIFKGCHPSGMHLRHNTAIHIHGSSESNSGINGTNIVVQVQNRKNLSTDNAPHP